MLSRPTWLGFLRISRGGSQSNCALWHRMANMGNAIMGTLQSYMQLKRKSQALHSAFASFFERYRQECVVMECARLGLCDFRDCRLGRRCGAGGGLAQELQCHEKLSVG